MIWNEALDQILIQNRGLLSAAKIAELVGHGVTRNAVIGRCTRLGLARLARTPAIRKERRPRLVGRDSKTRKPPTKEFASPPVPVVPLNIPFIELERRHCREIVGKDGFMSLSCGHPVVADSSYCRWHHAINYTSRAA